MTLNIDDFPIGKSVSLKKTASWPASAHLCERSHFAALVAAWHAGRPLLLRGEAGIGKSQMAHAAAQVLGWQFISVGIQPQTEYTELLWEFDAVSRLATAQLLGSHHTVSEDKATKQDLGLAVDLPDILAMRRYIHPGPLWWAYRPASAQKQCNYSGHQTKPFLTDASEEGGLVLLIDEIDKSDARLPNGLLEVLGNGDFQLPHGIMDDSDALKPLVIVTSNDERQLPIAFLRRCLVLDMKLPLGEADLTEYLIERAMAHKNKGASEFSAIEPTMMKEAAELVVKLRKELGNGYKLPGVAEYLDLLRVLGGLGGSKEEMQESMKEISSVVLVKRTQMDH